jgi:hypothetical protein
VSAGTLYFIAVKVILKPQLIFLLLLILGISTPAGRVSENNANLVASEIPASTQVAPPSVVFSIII